MSQLSLLSVEVGQGTDIKSSSAQSSLKKPTTETAFSDVIDQHYQEQKLESTNKKAKNSGNHEPVTAKEAEQHHALAESKEKIKGKISHSNNEQTPKDAHTLPVPILPEVETVKKGLGSGDDAHTLPVPILPEVESLKKGFSAGDDAHILPVPILPEVELVKKDADSADDAHTLPVPIYADSASLVKAADSSNNADILPITTSPLSKVSSGGADGTNKNNAFSVGANSISALTAGIRQETPSAQQVDVSNDDAVDLLTMLSGAQKLLTKATNEDVAGQLEENSALGNRDVLKQDNADPSLLKASQKFDSEQAVKQTVAAQALQSENQGNTAQKKVVAEAVTEQAASEKVILKNSEQLSPIAQQSLKKDTRQSTEATQASVKLNSNEDILVENVDEASQQKEALDHKVASNIARPESNNGLTAEAQGQAKTKTIDESLTANQVINQTQDKSQEITQQKVASAPLENQRASDVPQVRVVNQSTENIATSATKDQAQSLVSAQGNSNSSDESAGKNSDKAREEINLAKVANEKASPISEKAASMVNQTLDAQANRSAISSAEIAMQQQQGFESTIDKLSSVSNVQAQKSITALNTETIAIYRKDFANAVKEKVMVMINQKIQQVEIQLDPPEMGNVHVRLNLQNEQAAVQFVVQNQQAKEALEQNMGKLRDMLSESGVDVGDANIEQRQPGEQSETAFEERGGSGKNGNSAEQGLGENHHQIDNMVKASSTGVDYYA